MESVKRTVGQILHCTSVAMTTSRSIVLAVSDVLCTAIWAFFTAMSTSVTREDTYESRKRRGKTNINNNERGRRRVIGQRCSYDSRAKL